MRDPSIRVCGIRHLFRARVCGIRQCAPLVVILVIFRVIYVDEIDLQQPNEIVPSDKVVVIYLS